MRKGTVKWFNTQKGYGFITDEDGKDHFFHHTNIVMDGFRILNTNDLVEFETESTEDGKEQAIKVTPIVTMKMIRSALRKENLFVKSIKDAYGVLKYLVINADGLIQTSENGLSMDELIEYAGI